MNSIVASKVKKIVGIIGNAPYTAALIGIVMHAVRPRRWAATASMQ